MDESVVDAIILLRYLTDEPQELAGRAAELLQAAENRDIAVVVTAVTAPEIVYVLSSVYGRDRRDVAGGLLELIAADVFEVLERDVVMQSLIWYRDRSQLDFANAYVAAVARQRKATVMSFDDELRRILDVKIISGPRDV